MSGNTGHLTVITGDTKIFYDDYFFHCENLRSNPPSPSFLKGGKLISPLNPFLYYTPAGSTPRIPLSFSDNPIVLSLNRFPFRDSIELIPMAPSISFISCDQPVTRLASCSVAISGFCLLARRGSFVVIPQAHRPVLQVWQSVHPMASIDAVEI